MPKHERTNPLRHWLRANLPEQPPPVTDHIPWSLLRRYAEGGSATTLAAEFGLKPDALLGRIYRGSRDMGYRAPPSAAWLLPDGRVADHAVQRDEGTGCLLWTGSLEAGDSGPTAFVPQSHRSIVASVGQNPRVPVRRFLWERQHGPLPSDRFVVAACGHPACVNLDHAEVRLRYRQVPANVRRDLATRKHQETETEAAGRIGLSRTTVARFRGPGGKRALPPTALRSWLVAHLPEHQPTGIHDRDWAFARQYITGVLLAAIAAEAGVSRQMAQMRVKRLAIALGWTDME